MATAQFDRNDVIDRSIELFQRQGFGASSIQQVVKVTGLKPGSIYLAFGNKEGLYREALDGYGKRCIAEIRQTIEEAPSIGEGICTFLEEVAQESSKGNFCSCFLVKTRLELDSEDNELHKLASAKLHEVEELLQFYLEKEHGPEVSKQRAVSIMLHIFGMRIYGYQQGSTERMLQGLQEGLPWLPWNRTA